MAKKKSKDAAPVPEFAPIFKSLSALVPEDEEAEKRWPYLMSVLLPRYDDAGRLTRESGRLTITCKGTSFCVGIAAPTEGYTGAVMVHSLDAWMDTVEAAIAGNAVVWVTDFQQEKRARQRLKEALQ